MEVPTPKGFGRSAVTTNVVSNTHTELFFKYIFMKRVFGQL